jgi:hypothetical protein
MAGGAPIDVEARLKAMEYRGVGEKVIHTTQVACSASMLSDDPEEVIETILEATVAAAERAGLDLEL